MVIYRTSYWINHAGPTPPPASMHEQTFMSGTRGHIARERSFVALEPDQRVRLIDILTQGRAVSLDTSASTADFEFLAEGGAVLTWAVLVNTTL